MTTQLLVAQCAVVEVICGGAKPRFATTKMVCRMNATIIRDMIALSTTFPILIFPFS